MANIVITGAGRGIGLELVRQYAANGDRVFAMCRDINKADALNAIAAASNGHVSVHQMDVANDESVRKAATDIKYDTIDVLLNVAGVVGPTAPELELGSSNWSAWQDALNILLMAPLRVMQAFLPRMKSGSKVINFSSQLGASTWGHGGYYVYAAAKAGLNRLMRSVAIDLKDRGIIIGLVHPGHVQTDMGGPNAAITAQESALGVRQVTANWTLERSGDFLKWNGETHAW